MRLKDRNKFPPGGFRYYTAATNFSIQPWVSFDVAVAQIVAHRKANPYQSSVNGWSTDTGTVANELDAYNTMVCQQMNWNDYITDGSFEDLPKVQSRQSLSPRNAARVAEGIKTILEWEVTGGKLVEAAQANARAKVCSTCPKNMAGDLSSFFTEAAAKLIQLQLEAKNNLKLHTDYDPLLGLCDACGCVCKLKVWCPADIILSKMKLDTKERLDPGCWILDEERRLLDGAQTTA